MNWKQVLTANKSDIKNENNSTDHDDKGSNLKSNSIANSSITGKKRKLSEMNDVYDTNTVNNNKDCSDDSNDNNDNNDNNDSYSDNDDEPKCKKRNVNSSKPKKR